MTGWIKLQRSIIEWEWYDDIPVKVLFIHLLLTCNHKPQKWRGLNIDRGQLYTSIAHLAKDTSLSIKQVRRALEKLELTGEVRKEEAKGRASKGTLLTVCNYNTYQGEHTAEGKQKSFEAAVNGLYEVSQRATNNNDNNVIHTQSEDTVSGAILQAPTSTDGLHIPTIQQCIEVAKMHGHEPGYGESYFYMRDSKSWTVLRGKGPNAQFTNIRNWRSDYVNCYNQGILKLSTEGKKKGGVIDEGSW